MDNFAEQLVRKCPNSSDRFRKTMVIIGGTAIILLLAGVFVLTIGSPLSLFAVILALGTGFGVYYIVSRMYVEYEYTFTNGELDIDKIVAKSKRYELLSVEVRRFTAFGIYDDCMEETDDMTVVESSDNIVGHEYFADFEHEEYGKTRLIFAPNENMLESINKMLPSRLRIK